MALDTSIAHPPTIAGIRSEIDALWERLSGLKNAQRQHMTLWQRSPKAPAGGMDDHEYRAWNRGEAAMLARSQELSAEIKDVALLRNALILKSYEMGRTA